MEAAQVWNLCCELHKKARATHTTWPGRDALQKATKGRFALHSQSVQMVVHAFLANVETTRQLKPVHPKMRYPYKEKHFYPVHWPAQAVCREATRVLLPMGRGRPSLVLPLTLPETSTSCTLVWNYGFESHVCVSLPQAETAPGNVHATVDLVIVSGRGIRSLKRQRNQQLGKLARKQSRCQKYSRRWKKLQRAKSKMCGRAQRRIRDQRHKATRTVMNFCIEQEVGSLYIGNPHGVRRGNRGRHHNQRLALWEYGKDIDYLSHKANQAHTLSFTGTERGTSSQCPVCEHRHKPKGRNWVCSQCGFRGHRDLVGSVNMHKIAYGESVMFPRSITYLRPGPSRRSSRAGTPQCCLGQSNDQPRIMDTVSLETGLSCDVA